MILPCFLFSLTWKILQSNASRLYFFPPVNFKRLLPLPLKASCALKLGFCAPHSDEENPFLLKKTFIFSHLKKKGLEHLWKNDGMSVAFQCSSTSRATEADLHPLFQCCFRRRWLEMINGCRDNACTFEEKGKGASLKCFLWFFFSPLVCLHCFVLPDCPLA